MTGSELIGQGGGTLPPFVSVGNFTQTGGTHSVASLALGVDGQMGFSGVGSYSLSGGLLTVTGTELIGQGFSFSTCNFTQTGGTHSVASLVIGTGDQYGTGGNGSYFLGGGLLTVTGTEWIGHGGSYAVGSFTQTGGTDAVLGSLVLTRSSHATGTYNLNGGLLMLSGASGLVMGSGVAAFNSGGGTLQMGAGFTTSVPIALSISGSNGTFDTDGNTLTLTNALSGPGGFNKAGAGMLTLAGSDVYAGTTVVSGGTLALLADIPSPSFTANNGGTLLVSGATINLNTRYVQALGGGNVQYRNANIIGGFLFGPGTQSLPAGATTVLNATTINPGTGCAGIGHRHLHQCNRPGKLFVNGDLTVIGGIDDAPRT